MRTMPQSFADKRIKVNRVMQVYLVGGAVRDELLAYPSDENDYVVVGATPEAMHAQGFTPVGKDFPVFLHPKTKEEYALARTERKTGRGYQGFSFNASPEITLEQDLTRRDLTINAIAKSEHGEYVDPYGGKDDITNKRLRHVSNAFREDPVRILRTARFCARYHHLGFSIADETMALMQEMVANGEAEHLVAERVWKEWQRAFGERNPEMFIDTLQTCGALPVIAPECTPLFAQSSHVTASEAALSLTQACTLTSEPSVRLAAMLRVAPQDAWPNLASFFQRLNAPKQYSELCRLTVIHGDACDKSNTLHAEDIYALLEQCDAWRRPDRFRQLLLACHAHFTATQNTGTYPQGLFLNACLTQTETVNAQSFIAQGIQGPSLGEAIKAERITCIQHYKNESNKKL